MRKRSLSLLRNGQFDVSVAGKNHCGLDVGATTVRYEFYCECEVSLDSRGFLFQQRKVQEVLDKIGVTKLSCEELCMLAFRKISKAIRKDSKTCKVLSSRLKLSPYPYESAVLYEERA